MKNMFLLFVLFCSMNFVFGQSSTLSLQGVLREATGAAAADGDYAMTFKMYDVATGGTALWTETQTARVNNGVYSVQLGAVTALGLPFDKQYYVGVTVGGTELTPRMVLTAAPYTMSLRGSSNVFGGGGNVGIGTTAPTVPLDVRGIGSFIGLVNTGGSLLSGKTSVNSSADWYGGGLHFTSNATGASTKPFYWISRGFEDTDNRRHKMIFMVPNATDQPGAGYYFAENGGYLMNINNGTGDMLVKGKVTAGGDLGTTGSVIASGNLLANGGAALGENITAKGQQVPTAGQYNTRILSGIVKRVGGVPQFHLQSGGMSITGDGYWSKIKLPTGLAAANIIGATATTYNLSGENKLHFQIVPDATNADQINIRQSYFNNDDQNHGTFSFIIIVAY